MDPVDVQQIQELETLRTLWKLAVWFVGVSYPIATGLIIYFYNKSEKWRDNYVSKLEKDNDILKAQQ